MSYPTRKFPATILDKRINNGFFSRSYYMTVRFYENNAVYESEVSLQNYYDAIVGHNITITMYNTHDNIWSPHKPDDL